MLFSCLLKDLCFANIIFGNGVADARGSIAGTTFSRNRHGSYARNRTKPINTNTPYQSAVRNQIGSLSKQWGDTLTESERAAFVAIAPNHPVPNKLGQVTVLTGISFFQQLNMNLHAVGGTPITVPPADFSISALESVVLAVDSTPSEVMTIAVAPSALATNETLLVRATPMFPPGQSYFFNKLRVIGNVAASGTPIDILALWDTRYGSPALVAGQKIAVGVQVVNTVTGVASPMATAITVIT
jgi:hypothetical protein